MISDLYYRSCAKDEGVEAVPHAGLMNEAALGPVEGPLLRARLHLRGGRRRLRQGKISAGIATLSDALSGAFQWYVGEDGRRSRLLLNGERALNDDRTVYQALVWSGILDGQFDLNEFDTLVERALREDLQGYDYRPVLAAIEWVLLQLGVMPFDEGALPDEDPSTY